MCAPFLPNDKTNLESRSGTENPNIQWLGLEGTEITSQYLTRIQVQVSPLPIGSPYLLLSHPR